uniref:Uncharacterized protein n=1 Tax=Hippocampus comes TaxID=109280 RepID=A0A3Q2YI61_HIPCM
LKLRCRCRERYSHGSPNTVASCGGGSVMVWGCVSFTGKTKLVNTGGNLNAKRFPNEILQRMAIPYIHSVSQICAEL